MSEPTPHQPPPAAGPLGAEQVPATGDDAAGPVWPPEETEPDAGHAEQRGLVDRVLHPRQT